MAKGQSNPVKYLLLPQKIPTDFCCVFSNSLAYVSNLLRILHNNPNSNLNIAAILVSKWWLQSDLLIYTSFEPIGVSTGYNSQRVCNKKEVSAPLLSCKESFATNCANVSIVPLFYFSG